MKKIIILLLSILATSIIIFLLNSKPYNKSVISNQLSNTKISTNTISMMYETDYNSGEYQTSNDTNWPSEGYEFNETLSKCENGSSLTWDDKNKKVLMQANKSDK